MSTERIPTILRRLIDAEKRGDTVAVERIKKILAEVGYMGKANG